MQINTIRAASSDPTGLGNEEQSWRGAGDGFHVLLVVAAEVTQQQVVEDAHNTHQQQEAEDALPKQIARGAPKGISWRELDGCKFTQ